MKPEGLKRLERVMRETRVSESSNGRTLMTKVLHDKKKIYNRKAEKRTQNESSFFG